MSSSCRRAGSLVNLAENSERSLENRSKSSSLVFGIARPAPIFRTPSSASETAPPCAAPSKSICSIATGNCMAMLPTQHSMTPFCTLFQAVAEALGYKQNRLPFTLLSQRLPLAFLRSRREDAEALLFGVAGFLDPPDLNAQRKSTRGYLRSLWDRWWKYREQFSRLVLPAKLWKTSGARPLNHPHRRT